jgi:hypothetical protein
MKAAGESTRDIELRLQELRSSSSPEMLHGQLEKLNALHKRWKKLNGVESLRKSHTYLVELRPDRERVKSPPPSSVIDERQGGTDAETLAAGSAGFVEAITEKIRELSDTGDASGVLAQLQAVVEARTQQTADPGPKASQPSSGAAEGLTESSTPHQSVRLGLGAELDGGQASPEEKAQAAAEDLLERLGGQYADACSSGRPKDFRRLEAVILTCLESSNRGSLRKDLQWLLDDVRRTAAELSEGITSAYRQ